MSCCHFWERKFLGDHGSPCGASVWLGRPTCQSWIQKSLVDYEEGCSQKTKAFRFPESEKIESS